MSDLGVSVDLSEYTGPQFGYVPIPDSDERCERVTLTGLRCWRRPHVDWCCDFDDVRISSAADAVAGRALAEREVAGNA